MFYEVVHAVLLYIGSGHFNSRRLLLRRLPVLEFCGLGLAQRV